MRTTVSKYYSFLAKRCDERPSEKFILDVDMTFAKAYKEEITFAYYCFNLFLTIALFFLGTIYLRHRDRREQQRKEWREFSETIRGQYSTLKDKHVLSGVSKTKETFGNVLVFRDITGLDVLRYMLNNSDFESYSAWSRSSLCELREDLNSIFQLLNKCASLILLGPVPRNIRAELGKLVTDLGEMALPFFSGDERKTVLKCLKHFSRDGRPEILKTEKMREMYIDLKIEKTVPYIKYLSFDTQDNQVQSSRRVPYTKINKFQFKFDPVRDPADSLNILEKLQEDLQVEFKYFSDFAREFREHLSCPPSIDQVNSDDERLVVMNILHQVRVHMHSLVKNEDINEHDRREIRLLREIYERVTRLKTEDEIIRSICENFIGNLFHLKETIHGGSPSFRLGLGKVYETFCNLHNKTASSLPLTPTRVEKRDTNNRQYESGE